MKKGIVYLMSIILLAGGFAGCEKSTDTEANPDTGNLVVVSSCREMLG